MPSISRVYSTCFSDLGLFIMMLPAVFGAMVQEIGQLIDITLATSLEDRVPAAIPSLRYAHLVIHLPMGVFGVAVATASLPQLSRLYKENLFQDFQNRLQGSFLLNAFLLIPSSIGLFVLSKPIVALIFERGSFDANSTLATAIALKYYSAGIFAYSVQKLFLTAFYARKNSRVPAIITLFTLLANIGLSILLMPYLLHGGLALGSALAAFIGVFVYGILLVRNGGFALSRELVIEFSRILLLNACMCLFLVFALKFSINYHYVVQVAICIPSAIVLYISGARLLKIPEYDHFKQIVTSTFNRLKRKN